MACLSGGIASADSSAQAETIVRVKSALGAALSRDPDNRPLRFKYAQASYQIGQYDAAKYHLRYLMRDTPSTDELKALQKAYATVSNKSPFTYGMNFSLLPSTNVNKTASSSIFDTLLGRFTIEDGGAEESGLGYRFGGRINYETALPSGAVLTYGFEANRNQYPIKRLNRTDGTLKVTLSQNTVGGVSYATPYVTRFAYDRTDEVSSNSKSVGLRIGHERYLTTDSSVTVSATAERRNYDDKDYLDGSFFSASLGYQTQISEAYHIRVQGGISASTPEIEHGRYAGASLSGEVTRFVPNWGHVGLNLGFTKRQYEGDFPALGEPRADRSRNVGMSFRSQKFKVMGSSPKLSCKFQQNWSNVALYEYQSTDCALTFERNF